MIDTNQLLDNAKKSIAIASASIPTDIVNNAKRDLLRAIKTSVDLNNDGIVNINDIDLDNDGNVTIRESSEALKKMYKRFKKSMHELSYKKIYLSIVFSICSLIITTLVESYTQSFIDAGTMKFVSKLIVFAVSMIPLLSLDDLKRSMSSTVDQLTNDNSQLISEMTKKNDVISDLTYSSRYWEKRFNDVKSDIKQ